MMHTSSLASVYLRAIATALDGRKPLASEERDALMDLLEQSSISERFFDRQLSKPAVLILHLARTTVRESIPRRWKCGLISRRKRVPSP